MANNNLTNGLSKVEQLEIEYYIRTLERSGALVPGCNMCETFFYPEIRNGRKFPNIHAPRHETNPHCESGRRPHCSCDTCF
jgi:hypothetical protein